MPPLQAIISLVGIVIVIILAYYTTYYVGKKASGQNNGRNRGRNRSIILRERFAISKDKSFCILEIAGKIYLIGVTNQSMTLLDTHDAAEFEKSEVETTDAHTWNAAPGGPLRSKIVNRLASFIAQRMGKAQGTDANAGMMSRSFADSMKSAHERDISGQPDRKKSEGD